MYKPTIIFASLTLFGTAAHAEGFPPLSQHITDCEGKWILSESAKSNDVRLLGYVYVDPTAGFTIELHGEVGLAPDGALVRGPDELEGKARVIYRLEDNREAACLSDDQMQQLGLRASGRFAITTPTAGRQASTTLRGRPTTTRLADSIVRSSS